MLLVILALFSACSTSGVPSAGETNRLDVPDATQDAWEGVDSQETSDSANDHDFEPKDCSAYLPMTQCVSNDDCLSFETCLGSLSCPEPPCYGLCDAFPGVCAPKPTPRSCVKKGDCPQGFLCQRFSPSKPDTRGICIHSPSPDACFSDEDCKPSFVCAWAHVCDPFDICLSPDYPGRCLPKPPNSACYQDNDCKPDEHCENAFVCAFDDEACVSKMGECKSGGPFGCMQDADCLSGSSSAFCVESFTCKATACPVADKKGFCVKPVVGQCYTDAFCSKNYLCVSSFPCPPQTTCAERGFPGFCLSTKDLKPSVTVSIEGEDFSVGKTLYALIVNQSAFPVFLDPCYAGFVKVDGSYLFPPLSLQTCAETEQARFVTLPSGKGFAIPFVPGFPGTYQIETIFKIGCEQGAYSPTCATTLEELKSDSMPFKVQ